MRSILVVPAILAAGCACKPPITVEISIPVPCIARDKVPTRPYLVSDVELVQMQKGQVPLALDAHRMAVMLYVAELEAVVNGCSMLPGK